MMILQHTSQIKVERMSSPGFAFVNCASRSPVSVKEEPVEEPEKDSAENDCVQCVPLDLSLSSGRVSPGVRDSGTESDDSGGRCSPEGADCKAYKKSLMKRYCKSCTRKTFGFLPRTRFKQVGKEAQLPSSRDGPKSLSLETIASIANLSCSISINDLRKCEFVVN